MSITVFKLPKPTSAQYVVETMQRLKIFLSTLCFVVHLNAQALVDDELTRIMQTDSSRQVSLILVFKPPHNTAMMQLSNLSVQKRKMALSNLAQAQFLKQQSRFGPLNNQNLKSFWINNSIVMKTAVSEVASLMQREDIESIMLDRTIFLEEPTSSVASDMDQSEKFTYGLIKIGIPELRKKYNITGKGVIVGLLDSGWAEHPDLGDRVKRSRDFVSDKPDNKPNDGHGHGTHCLGTIGGSDTSGKSIGVAPDVEFIVGKIYRDDASTEASRQIEAMQWMADPDGNPDTPDHPKVVSNSWGWKFHQMPDASAFQRAVQTWRELGIVPIFSAGNSGPWKETIGYPGGFPETIAIGATDADDEIASFSSRGPVLRNGDLLGKPNISGPGVDVYSGNLTGGYVKMSGTSMSAPHVAGVVALLFQVFPELGVRGIEQILNKTAVDLGDAGFDYKFGSGRVDALAAVEQAMISGRLFLPGSENARGSMRVTLQPGHHVYELVDGEALDIVLEAGKYQLRVEKFGFQEFNQSVDLKALKSTVVAPELSPLPQAEVEIITKVKDDESWVIIHDSPFGILTTVNGRLKQNLPYGRYKISVVRKGFESQSFDLNLSSDQSLEIALESAPDCLVVNDDPEGHFGQFYTAALGSYKLSNRVQLSKTLSMAQLLAYNRVIWFTGNAEENVLDGHEQIAIQNYLEMGGQLLLTGHGIGNDLKGSSFFYKVLGARYQYQRRLFRDVKFVQSGYKLKLNGDDSADNQSKPDVLKPFSENSISVLKYSLLGSAGILHRFGTGKVLYLGFGIEGIRGADARAVALQQLFGLLKPSVEDQLLNLKNTFISKPQLHGILSRNFSQVKSDKRVQLIQAIKQTSDKRAYQKLMFELSKEQ